MLHTALQEMPLADSPFFHVPSHLSKVLRCEAPPNAALRGALVGLGYKVARSHCKPNSIKTNAPHSVMWEVMRHWLEQKPQKEGTLKEGSPGYKIMQKPKDENLKVVFDKERGEDTDKLSGIVRYQVNPTANWGPMERAKGSGGQAMQGSEPVDESSPGKKRVK
jgi:tRNA (guanine26-N2/guanine27-N2)-dimethyltransferase